MNEVTAKLVWLVCLFLFCFTAATRGQELQSFVDTHLLLSEDTHIYISPFFSQEASKSTECVPEAGGWEERCKKFK